MDNRDRKYRKRTSAKTITKSPVKFSSLKDERSKKSNIGDCYKKDKRSRLEEGHKSSERITYGKNFKKDSIVKRSSTTGFLRKNKIRRDNLRLTYNNSFDFFKESEADQEREIKKRKVKLNLDSYKEYVDYISNNVGAYKTVVANRDETDSLLKFIGLCKRAGALVQGASIVDDNLSKHKISLLIIACDASKNAKKLFKHKIERESLAAVYFSNKKELASILGRDEVVYIGIIDKNFAKGLWEKFYNLLK